MTSYSPIYFREQALESLRSSDPTYPESNIGIALADPANDHLLQYVFADAFTHVFPGDRTDYPPTCFFSDLDAELTGSPSFHLWINIPLCQYRCHFCQFPVLVLSHDEKQAAITARQWVDANIAEAKLWLEAVPAMRKTPIGEFCLFGGTPTTLPIGELERLINFYIGHFNFTN